MNLTKLPAQVTKAVRNVVGNGPIKLHEPSFTGNEMKYVEDCINSTYVSSVGKYVDQFEIELSKYTGANYAISVVNGTAALHLALKLAGVNQGDEVLVQAFTFVATANAISYCGAVPHFVDTEKENLGIDPVKLQDYLAEITVNLDRETINKITGRRIKALVVMHTFGHPSKMDELLEVSKKFNLKIIEDAAESIGSYYKNKHTGTMGLLGTLSFNGNKTITTGGGGALLTNNLELARKAKHLSTTAKISHKWAFEHDEIGYNYRMPNINAALGCAQLEDLPLKLENKEKLFNEYKSQFSKIEGVSIVEEPTNCRSNYWLQTIKLDLPNLDLRNEILEDLNSAGFMSRPGWDLINSLQPYRANPSMTLECAKELFACVINVPSNHAISLRVKQELNTRSELKNYNHGGDYE
jgi:aminotransferase in exopolysaccharide biosynthesis